MAIRISMNVSGDEQGRHTHYVAGSFTSLTADSEFIDDWGDPYLDIQDADTLIADDGAVVVTNNRGNLCFSPLESKEAPGYNAEEEAEWRVKVAAEKA